MTYRDVHNIIGAHLQFAKEAAELDLWDHDLVTGEVTRKPTRLFDSLGYGDAETAACLHDGMLAFVHPDDIALLDSCLADYLAGITAQYRCEFRLRANDGRWVWFAKQGKLSDRDAPGRRLVGITVNIDERKRNDAQRDALTRALKLVSACSTAMIQAHTEAEFLRAICTLAVDTGGYRMAWIGFAEDDPEKSVRPVAQSGFEQGYLEHTTVTWSDSILGRGPVGTAIKTGATTVNQDYETNPQMQPWRDSAIQRGYRASIALPLFAENRVCGVFSTYAADPFSFGAAEVTLLEELAGNISYGIQTLRSRARHEQTRVALQAENEKNLALLHNASDGIHIIDLSGRLIEASDSFCSMLGYQRAEMIGMHITQWDAQLSESEIRTGLAQQFSAPVRIQFETRHRRKDGSLIDVEISGQSLNLNDKLVLFNSSRDITHRKQAEEALQEKQRLLLRAERQYRELLSNLHIAIVVHGADTRILFSNPRASELLGLSDDQMRGKIALDPAWNFIAEDGQVMAPYEYPVNRVIRSLKPMEGLVLGVTGTKTAKPVWLLVNAFPEFQADGSLNQVVIDFDDISARKQAEAQIHSLAFFDDLTGLPNRRLLTDRFHSALSASTRCNCYGAVLFIDMDRFKTVNDVLGHEFGDLLLIEATARIRSCVREVDTVARIGGDEFVVLLVEVDEQLGTASQKTALVAEKIRLALTRPYQLRGNEQHCSSSIGVSMYHGNQETPGDLLRQADIAMYKSKDAGRNAVRFFNPAMQLAVEVHAALEADLRHAVPDGQLQLYYQIQVDSDQRALGAEALVRWLHPKRGMVPPMQFIPVAEESSLILDIGGWVLETACRQLVTWAGHAATRDLTLAVNVSAQQFRQADFVETLAAMLRRHGTVAARLKLELTESVVLNDVNDVVSKMYALKGLGVKLSMDDFGTGYSSLAYLKQLPLDQIKIDQSFVRDITTDPNDAVMVKTIIDLAKNFRLHVIAEGVETESQLAFLQLHGCMAYQGYLFSRPVPIAQFEALLKQAPDA
ncbi:diguanylate cyclase (GGDEF)-like protein/PAS domain S-box-containing protein [Actimicrobium sp. GrIS 1.19]|uniref:sensor domain-containing phosphodiesterase n=1 Tax=Actimicrobium sp. GrIS 1.19 TaxID=3071708 RepID=UPI002DF83ACE|nr:diguanylate cyclase (GGDEF)-like protein/PAS domain S-box-containing protein [Actimicrobium sp. GrIS 1.19]